MREGLAGGGWVGRGDRRKGKIEKKKRGGGKSLGK